MPTILTGVKRLKTITPNTMQAMAIASDRIMAIVQTVAKNTYIENKLSPGPSNLIISSFKYLTEFGGIGEVRSFVLAGGSKAPYASFVDRGRSGRRGSFGGHHFMHAGAEEGKRIAGQILLEELRKQTRRFGGGEILSAPW